LAPVLSPQVIHKQILPIFVKMSKDPVPNVRFNVAKSLEIVIPLLKKNNLANVVNDEIKPELIKMSSDVDGDVRYFSQKAMATLSAA
jgi:serine/threonine-protein phosphatase 2A regulatory subunit A